MDKKKTLILQTFYTFFVNGFTALLIGSVLTFIQNDYKFDHTMAGLFLALHSLGNLFASFVAVVAINKIGRKKAIIALSSLVAISYTGIILFSNIYILCVMFFLTGLGRGSISNVNNSIVNDLEAGRSGMLNLLHTCFAVGAFITPFMASLFISNGLGWRSVLMAGVSLAISMVIVYCFMDIDKTVQKVKAKKNSAFYKNVDFYIAAMLLFFYLGTENCVNGWLVTYFKESGIVSVTVGQKLLSLVWVVIIIGRLLTAYLSEKNVKKETLILINSIGAALMFVVLLNATTSMLVIVSVAAFGFFLAGVYPTTIASTGKYLKGTPEAMATLLAFAGTGGIIMPYIVGFIADKFGIAAGMTLISFDMAIVVVFAIILKMRKSKVCPHN